MHGKVNNQDEHEKKKILRKLSLYNANVFCWNEVMMVFPTWQRYDLMPVLPKVRLVSATTA